MHRTTLMYLICQTAYDTIYISHLGAVSSELGRDPNSPPSRLVLGERRLDAMVRYLACGYDTMFKSRL
jgi:hypothetical protein